MFNFRFEKSSKKYDGLHVSHKVPKYQLYYEPFYVSLNNVPIYDERFIGYGYTRNSQVDLYFLLNIFKYNYNCFTILLFSGVRDVCS